MKKGNIRKPATSKRPEVKPPPTKKKKEVMIIDESRRLHAVKDKIRYVCKCGWIIRGNIIEQVRDNYCSGCGIELKWEM